MKKNGQALVEFIIILPILIIILLGIIDFGLIFYKKNILEDNLDEVVEIWKDSASSEEVNSYINEVDNDIKFVYVVNGDVTTLELISDYKVITPGLNNILGNKYEIRVNRVIYNG